MIQLTDEVLAHRLAERAERAPAMSLAAIARSVAVEPRRRTPAAGRSAILAPIAAVFLLAVVVAGGLLSRSSQYPAGSASPGASSTIGSITPGSAPPSSPAAGPEAIAAWSSLIWEKTSTVPFESDETTVNDAIAVGHGFLAVGTTRGSRGILTGHVWRSVDGRVWERIDDPGIATLVPARILKVGDAMVVLGDRQPQAGDVDKNVELWRSADGTIWTQGPSLPVNGDGQMAAGGPAGILLPVGHRTFVIGPGLDAWTETTTWPAGVYLGAPAWANGRWIQPGATGVTGPNAPTTATIWSSPDGSTWTPTTMAPSGGAVFQVFPAADGLVAIGQSANLCLMCRGPLIQAFTAWSSPDGESWSGVDLPLARGFRPQFVGDGTRLLAIGPFPSPSGSGAATSLISTTLDGRTWTPIVMDARSPDESALSGTLIVGLDGVALMAAPRDGSADRTPQVWWGLATPAAAQAPSPSPSVEPSPPVTGCDTLGFDARRCAAVVARAEQSIDDPHDVVSILVKPWRGAGVSLGSFAIATVDFTMAGGTTRSADVRCMLVLGPKSSDRACAPDPQIGVAGGVSHDTPCGPTPGDETHPCGPLPPDPAPAAIAAAQPLILRTFDIPIDHVGHYEVLVGTATIPNGAISEISADVGDPRPSGFWIDPYIQIEVRPDRGGPPIDTYYGRRVKGQLPVHVYLVFDVTELTVPGTILEVRNLVVR